MGAGVSFTVEMLTSTLEDLDSVPGADSAAQVPATIDASRPGFLVLTWHTWTEFQSLGFRLEFCKHLGSGAADQSSPSPLLSPCFLGMWCVCVCVSDSQYIHKHFYKNSTNLKITMKGNKR